MDELDQAKNLLSQAHHAGAARPAILSEAKLLIDKNINTTRNPYELVKWRTQLWHYHLYRSEHAAGLEVLNQVLHEMENLPELTSSEQAEIFKNYSFSLITQGKLEQAKHYLRQGIVLAQGGDPDILSLLYLSIADAYRKSGQATISRRYFQSAFDLNKNGINDLYANSALLKIGNIDRQQSNIPHAIEKHRIALAYYEKENLYREIVAIIELGWDHLLSGETEKALSYARQAVADERAQEEQVLDSHILLIKAINATEQTASLANEAHTAILSVRSLLENSKQRQASITTRPIRQLAFFEAAITHFLKSKNSAEVIFYGERALELISTISRNHESSSDDHFAWLSQAQTTYAAYIRALYNLAPEKIFATLEQFNRLVQGVNVSQTERNLNTGLEEQSIKSFEKFISAEKLLVEYITATQVVDDGVKFGLEQQRDIARERFLSDQFNQRTQPTQLPKIEVQTTLHSSEIPKGDLLINYYFDDELSFLIAKSRYSEKVTALPPRHEIRTLVLQTLEELSKPGIQPQESNNLLQLSQLLPASLLEGTEGISRLIVVPNDIIHHLPFSAVNISNDPGDYLPLVSHFEVVQTFSPTEYFRDLKPARQFNNSIVIFADPVLAKDNRVSSRNNHLFRSWSDDLRRLPHTAQEASAIQGVYTEADITLYLDHEATSQALLSQVARNADILHIATHGYFNELTPDIVGIATTPTSGEKQSGFLVLNELFDQKYKANLIVVSGCSTMRGKSYNGIGVRSLSQGLLASGAGSVLGTLWPIPDRTTATFMKNFYQQLKENNGNSATALRLTKQEFQRNRRYRDPMYWAGFVLHSSSWAKEQQALPYP